jgi:hypothetical protein
MAHIQGQSVVRIVPQYPGLKQPRPVRRIVFCEVVDGELHRSEYLFPEKFPDY